MYRIDHYKHVLSPFVYFWQGQSLNLCVFPVSRGILMCVFVFPQSGYTVTSVVSARNGRLLVAGAPRFNHTGKVIIFTLKNSGNLTILHSLKGQQVPWHSALILHDNKLISCEPFALRCSRHVFSGRRNVIKHCYKTQLATPLMKSS